jgi:hypothetical protein
MTAMVSTVLRGPRGFLRVVTCALLTASPLLSGCARAIDGNPQAAEAQTTVARPVPIAELLIEPTRFPGQYPAVVVDPSIVPRLLRQIDGVPEGSTVTPPECAPPPVVAPEGAAVQGVDQESGASLIVTVTRPAPSLRARIDQLAGCSSFTSAIEGDAPQMSEVTVELPPAPPVDADDSYAVDQTVTPESPGASGTRTLTLVAGIADVQVTASWQGIVDTTDAAPDAGQLDALFTDAVLKVRSAIPR